MVETVGETQEQPSRVSQPRTSLTKRLLEVCAVVVSMHIVNLLEPLNKRLTISSRLCNHLRRRAKQRMRCFLVEESIRADSVVSAY